MKVKQRVHARKSLMYFTQRCSDAKVESSECEETSRCEFEQWRLNGMASYRYQIISTTEDQVRQRLLQTSADGTFLKKTALTHFDLYLGSYRRSLTKRRQF